MIISASRRTDIPAFYSKWFAGRLKAGFVLVQNPYNKNHARRISLEPENLDAVVFWSKNPKPMFDYLPLLDEREIFYYFQYTLTGYPKIIEPIVPTLLNSIETFQRLSDKLGPRRIVWRFDPVLTCENFDTQEVIRLFSKIASSLFGYTEKVVISFLSPYLKISKRIQRRGIREGVNENDVFRISSTFSAIAASYNIRVESCADSHDLTRFNIGHGKCIDGNFINRQLLGNRAYEKDKYQREECLCSKSVDIGVYNTCPHGCVYCYATHNPGLAIENFKSHDVAGETLAGHLDPAIKIVEDRQMNLI